MTVELCRNGHRRTPSNTATNPTTGRRCCLTCRRLSEHRRYLERTSRSGPRGGAICGRGHRWTHHNTLLSVTPEGRVTRHCRACRRLRDRAKNLTPEFQEYERARYAAGRRTGPPLTLFAPEHGTLKGYNFHRCRCQQCRAAIARAHRAARLKRKARRLGIRLVPPSSAAPMVVSLDALADAIGYDRIGTGSEWDDPVFDAVARRWGDFDPVA